jgi:heme oxygenase
LYSSVKRHIVARLPQTANACAYLSSYDGVAAARWQQLGVLLDQQAWKHGHERLVTAAVGAFECARRWYPETLARGA